MNLARDDGYFCYAAGGQLIFFHAQFTNDAQANCLFRSIRVNGHAIFDTANFVILIGFNLR